MNKPYIPVYTRPPNKLQTYEERRFTDRSGNSGIERIAHYLDKNGKPKEMTAQVIWDKEPSHE